MTAPATNTVSLAGFSDQLAQAVESAARSIVAVHARERLASTGVHWRDGLIVTTAATVRREQGIEVTTSEGTRVHATLVGRDVASDLALLRIESATVVPGATRAEPGRLRPGNLVMAVARLDGSGPRVSFGAVSRVGGAWRTWKGGEYGALIQSGFPLHPGFGGSPLVDVEGHVHGINSGGLSQELTTTIPNETVERVLAHLLATGSVPRGWLGAALQPVRFSEGQAGTAANRESGLLIVGLAEGGPAATSGLLVGDIVLSVDGSDMHEPHDVLDALERKTPGTVVSFDLLRGGARVIVPVTIGARPQEKEGRRRRSWSGR